MKFLVGTADSFFDGIPKMSLYVKDLFLKVYSDFAILAIFGEVWGYSF